MPIADNMEVGLSRLRLTLAAMAALLVICLTGPAAPANAAHHHRKGHHGHKHRHKATLQRKIGWGPLSDRKAAQKVHRTKHEVRPKNRKANHTVPTKAQIKKFRRKSDMPYAKYVDGHYKGTTDDIIEWAAYKWGLPEDLLRAVAVTESWWDQSHVNKQDHFSYGLFQVRTPYHCCLPEIKKSTAFNADYYGGIIRAYFDGKQKWLNNPDVRPENGKRYKAGDLWDSIGAWYSGRWHISANQPYIDAIRKNLRERTWKTDPYFDESKR